MTEKELKALQSKNFFLQEFAAKLNTNPLQNEVERTPDKKAYTIPIGIIEMKLDQIYFGLWQTHSFTTSVMANEVVGSIVLELTHPVTGETIKRTGAASIQITVDALTDEEKNKMTKQEKNAYALNINNKKPNALDLTYPKLKTECIKNAALSLGKTFGRDLNRKIAPAEFKRSVKQPKQVEELTPNHSKWNDSIKMLATEQATILQLETRFSISEEAKTLLTDAAIEYQQNTTPKATH